MVLLLSTCSLLRTKSSGVIYPAVKSELDQYVCVRLYNNVLVLLSVVVYDYKVDVISIRSSNRDSTGACCSVAGCLSSVQRIAVVHPANLIHTLIGFGFYDLSVILCTDLHKTQFFNPPLFRSVIYGYVNNNNIMLIGNKNFLYSVFPIL